MLTFLNKTSIFPKVDFNLMKLNFKNHLFFGSRLLEINEFSSAEMEIDKMIFLKNKNF